MLESVVEQHHVDRRLYVGRKEPFNCCCTPCTDCYVHRREMLLYLKRFVSYFIGRCIRICNDKAFCLPPVSPAYDACAANTAQQLCQIFHVRRFARAANRYVSYANGWYGKFLRLEHSGIEHVVPYPRSQLVKPGKRQQQHAHETFYVPCTFACLRNFAVHACHIVLNAVILSPVHRECAPVFGRRYLCSLQA